VRVDSQHVIPDKGEVNIGCEDKQHAIIVPGAELLERLSNLPLENPLILAELSSFSMPNE
jgi:hypothetical protein